MGADVSVNAHEFAGSDVPDFDGVGVEGDDAEEGGVEYDGCAGFLVGEELVFGLVVLEVLESFAAADDALFHELALGGGVGEAK